MSDPRKDQGYLLPDPVTGWDLICVTLKIPDVPEYRAAFRGALKSLTEWHKWQRTDGTEGTQAASYWRQLLHEHLRFMDCYDLGEEIGEVARPILCKFINENGTVDYKISYNDGCTWEIIPLCDDSVGEEIPDIVPPENPIDVPGENVPDPDVDSENPTQQRCNVVTNVFQWFLLTRVDAFLPIFELGLTAVPNALLGWIDATTEDIADYYQFYATYKALFEKYYPDHDTWLASFDNAVWTELVECVVFDCLPADLKITREVLNCISDAIEASDWDGGYAPFIKIKEFLADYVRALPLEAVRRRAFRYSTVLDTEEECGSCEDPVEPDPIVCDIRLNFDFKNSEDALGFISLTEPPLDFACGDHPLKASYSFYPAVHMPNGGITISQNSSSSRVLGIAKEFTEPYQLCQLNIPIPNGSGRLNSRYAAVWYRDAVGVWTCLASRYIAIYKNGQVDLVWSGSVTATGIAVIAWTGGGNITVQKIDMNYGVLEA